jgi:hypothetical protein
MELKIRSTKYDNTYKMLSILATASELDMSDLEKAIITTLISNGYTSITPISKEVVRRSLDKDKFITNNYIKRLKDKNIILADNKGILHIDAGIVNCLKDNKISFEFEAV